MDGRAGTVLLAACLCLAPSDVHARPLLSQDDATTRSRLELLRRMLPDKPDAEAAIEALRFVALGGEYPPDSPTKGTRKGVVTSFQCTAGEPRTLASFSEVGVSALPIECEAESNGGLLLVDLVSRLPRLMFFERIEYRASLKSLHLRFRLLVPFYPTPVGVEGEKLVGSLIQVVEALKDQTFGLEHVLSQLLLVGDGRLTSLEIQGRWTLAGDSYRFVESPSWKATGVGLGTSGGFRRAAFLERNFAVTLLDAVVRRRAEGPCTKMEIEGRWQLSPPSSGVVVAAEANAPAAAQTEAADPPAEEATLFVSQVGRPLLLGDEPCPSDRDPADRQLVVPPQSGQGDLTLRLRDVDLADVFRALSDLTGQGFLVDQNVVGRATIDFSRVTLDDALRALERTAGLSVSRPSRIRRVSVGRAARGWAPPSGPIWPPTRPVSFDMKRWQLDDLLSLLQDISALSVEAPAELRERVTVRVDAEPWALLYESILGALGLRMELSGQNAIRVRRGDERVSPLALRGNNEPRALLEDVEIQDVRFVGIAARSGRWLAAFYGPIAAGLHLKEAGFRFRNAVLKSVDAEQVTVGWSTNLLDPDRVVLRLPVPLRLAAGRDSGVSSERAREAASPAAAFYARAASGELGVPIDSRSRLEFHRILVQYLLDLGGEEETARRAVRDGIAAAAALDLSDPELASTAALIAEQASHLKEPIEALWPKLSALASAPEGGGLAAGAVSARAAALGADHLDVLESRPIDVAFPLLAFSPQPSLDAAAQYKLGMKYATGKGVPKDAAKAAEWFQKAAAQGHAAAQYKLGRMYFRGEGLSKDATKAVEWYQKAAAQGDAAAQNNLGWMYQHSRGVLKDAAKAVEWYQKAAAQGLAIAQINLGLMYESGEDVPKDAAKAVEWYRKAAAHGDAAAQRNVGWMYQNGKVVPKDAAKAAEWYRKAAAHGDAGAQVNLGQMYENGEGVRKDAAKAAEWYQKAAAQGYANAQYNLGQMYDNGFGVPKDAAKAVEWYQKAATQGHADAQYNLGQMYDNGEGVPKDAAKGVEWFQKAAAQGHGAAQSNLSMKYWRGEGVPKDGAKAVEWYEKAATQGDVAAQYNLGQMYEHGEGVPKDAAKAVEWYQKAAAQGRADAQSNLGLIYANGEGVPKDAAKAVEWFGKAGAQGDGAAQIELGLAYAAGDGVPKDAAKAVEWYQKAAAQGYVVAEYNLAVMYESGEGVPKDHVLAFAWTTLATYYEPAAKLRETLEPLLSAEERAEAQRLSSGWKEGTVLVR